MDRGRLAIVLATGASLGVVTAYLLAGGASYQPLEAADPCETRPPEVLAERGVFEGLVLSALDGAACELQVSREDLAAALTSEQELARFSEERGITEEQTTAAVRAGLRRAIDDAEARGSLAGPAASFARAVAEQLPIGAALELFRTIPGDPSVPDLLRGLQEAGLTVTEIEQLLDELAAELREAGESPLELLPLPLP